MSRRTNGWMFLPENQESRVPPRLSTKKEEKRLMDLLPAWFRRRPRDYDTTHRHSVLDASPTLSLREGYFGCRPVGMSADSAGALTHVSAGSCTAMNSAGMGVRDAPGRGQR